MLWEYQPMTHVVGEHRAGNHPLLADLPLPRWSHRRHRPHPSAGTASTAKPGTTLPPAGPRDRPGPRRRARPVRHRDRRAATAASSADTHAHPAAAQPHPSRHAFTQYMM
ncbi:hypothetical protein HBB16_12520 [Pseudonocardia sp. MCCB 268]|nr:hypothetical protein [Pseudonocardia cytotoxica]